MIDKIKLLAHCGLYCGDCAGFSGDIASAAIKLKVTLCAYNFKKNRISSFFETTK